MKHWLQLVFSYLGIWFTLVFLFWLIFPDRNVPQSIIGIRLLAVAAALIALRIDKMEK